MLSQLEQQAIAKIDDDELICWVQELTRIPSVWRPDDGVGEEEAARWVEARCREIGLETHFEMVRLGVSQYGLWSSKETLLSFMMQHRGEVDVDLEPVLTWKSRISQVKDVPGNAYIGYGCTYRTVHDTLVAVLPVGYAEGYPRAAGEQNSYVLISGGRCPVLGRICMNMMMVDVSHLPVPPKPGDTATLIGRDGEEVLDAMTLAGWAGTIHYELVTCLNPAIPRRVLDGNSP